MNNDKAIFIAAVGSFIVGNDREILVPWTHRSHQETANEKSCYMMHSSQSAAVLLGKLTCACTTRCICVKPVWNACETHVKIFTQVKGVWNFKFHTIWCVKICVKFGTAFHWSWNLCETCVKYVTRVKFRWRFKFHTISCVKNCVKFGTAFHWSWNLCETCVKYVTCVKFRWIFEFHTISCLKYCVKFGFAFLDLETCLKHVWNMLHVWMKIQFSHNFLGEKLCEIWDCFPLILASQTH